MTTSYTKLSSQRRDALSGSGFDEQGDSAEALPPVPLTRSESGNDRRPLVPAISRAAAVLDAIMENGGEALSLAELARQLRVPKSSLGNVCHQLVAERLLRRVENTYRLGPKLAGLGAVFLSSVDFAREFQDACMNHVPAIAQTTKLAVLGDHGDTIYLSRYDPIRPASLVIDTSVQQPAHCTASGKAMLACLPEDDFSKWIKDRGHLHGSTKNSIGAVGALRDEVDKIRLTGIAFDAEECHDGVFCVGTALASENDPTDVLGLSFALLAQQATGELVEHLTGEITRLATELAGRLGGGYLALTQFPSTRTQRDDGRADACVGPSPRPRTSGARRRREVL